jgi:hypothetical protein
MIEEHMDDALAKCLRIGKELGYLTYSQVNDIFPDDAICPEKLDELLDICEAHGIPIVDERGAESPTGSPGPSPHFHSFSPEELNGWKSYPIRIPGPRLSKCHGKPTLLVQSTQGGFVTANCSECGDRDTLSEDEFLSLQGKRSTDRPNYCRSLVPVKGCSVGFSD